MRSCGSCTMCCKVMSVAAIDKPANKWCQHCDNKGQRCTIYEDRPETCREFECIWLQGDIIPHDLKPDRSRVVFVTSNEGGLTALVDPGMPLAWQEPKMLAYLKAISRDLTVVVDNGTRAWHIKPWGASELPPHRIKRGDDRVYRYLLQH